MPLWPILTGSNPNTSGYWPTAPDDAQYLTLAATTRHTSERVLTLGQGLSGSDGGAGGAYTITAQASTGSFVSASQSISTTIPLQGGGTISSGLTLSIRSASAVDGGGISVAEWVRLNDLANNYVTSSRAINTTSPIQGGGALTADRTISIVSSSAATAGAMSAADFSKLSGIPANADGTFNTLGAATASFSVNSQRITNVGSPTAGVDAATRGWVESITGTFGSLSDLPPQGVGYGPSAGTSGSASRADHIHAYGPYNNTSLVSAGDAYTVLLSDLNRMIFVRHDTQKVKLPAISSVNGGTFIELYDAGNSPSGSILVLPNGSNTIDGFTTASIARGGNMRLVADTNTSKWHMIQSRAGNTVFDVDFTVLSGTTIVTGANQFAGVTWTADNVANSLPQMGITSSTGLVITPVNSPNTDMNSSTRTAPLLRVNLSGTIPDFDPRARLVIWCYFTGSTFAENYDSVMVFAESQQSNQLMTRAFRGYGDGNTWQLGHTINQSGSNVQVTGTIDHDVMRLELPNGVTSPYARMQTGTFRTTGGAAGFPPVAAMYERVVKWTPLISNTTYLPEAAATLSYDPSLYCVGVAAARVAAASTFTATIKRLRLDYFP